MKLRPAALKQIPQAVFSQANSSNFLSIKPSGCVFLGPAEATYNSESRGSQANPTKVVLLNSAITESNSLVYLITETPDTDQPAQVSFWCTSVTPTVLS